MNEHLEPKRLLSYLFILAIAFLFAIQWGPGSRGCDAPLSQQQGNVAATVNGKEIPLGQFNRAYSNQLNYLRQQGSPITEAMARQLGFHSQIINEMVKNELLAQAAQKQGVQASDEEVLKLLHQNPSFQKDGRFDFEQYRQTLRDWYRQTPGEFEAELRRQLSAQKLIELVENAAAVSDEEVKAKFYRDGNKASATVVRFLPSMYAEKVTAPKPEELAGYLKEHQHEIAGYYEANRLLYHQPERVRARHILLKLEPDAPQAKQDEAKRKLENLRKEIEGGKDFAQLAKDFSEDLGSKEKGGDLGLSERAGWVPEFAEAAFSLEPGKISAPVRTQYGWHLVRSEEKRPPEQKELKEVESEIARQLWTKAKAKQLAEAQAQKTLAAVKAGKSLSELHPPGKEPQAGALRFQTESKPEAIETGEFNSATESVPQLGPAPELVKAIFAREAAGPLEQLFPTGEGYAVAVVTSRKKPSEEELLKEKDALRAEALQGKRYELRDAFVKSLRQSSTVVINEQAIGRVQEAG